MVKIEVRGGAKRGRAWRRRRSGKAEIQVNDDIKVDAVGYYQDRQLYGIFPVSRSDDRTQITNAYRTSRTVRPDMYTEFLYRNAAGVRVPIGTPGAIPTGYTDTNGNGFFDANETINATATVTEFSNAHAIVACDSRTLASAISGIPGATGRDEDFGGQRVGTSLKGSWTKGNNKLTVGGNGRTQMVTNDTALRRRLPVHRQQSAQVVFGGHSRQTTQDVAQVGQRFDAATLSGDHNRVSASFVPLLPSQSAEPAPFEPLSDHITTHRFRPNTGASPGPGPCCRTQRPRPTSDPPGVYPRPGPTGR